MKRVAKIAIIITIALNVIVFLAPQKIQAQGVSVSFQLFYDELSPYGTWVDYPGYGYAWIPSGDPDFYPYSTNGYWAYTYCGWTWVSNYHWGWAPFHYGRWHFDPFYGWIWLPGTQWGPAWVVWAYNDGYYGWAPMAPGMSINVYYNTTYIHHDHWVFVHKKDFGGRSYVYAPRGSNASIMKTAKVIDNEYVDQQRGRASYISGPKKEQVQKETGKSVTSYEMKENGKPESKLKGTELSMYRPEVNNENNKATKPAPAHVKKMDEVKPSKGAKTESNEKSFSNKNDEQVAQRGEKESGYKQEKSDAVETKSGKKGWKNKEVNKPSSSAESQEKERPVKQEARRQEKSQSVNKAPKQESAPVKKEAQKNYKNPERSSAPAKKNETTKKPR